MPRSIPLCASNILVANLALFAVMACAAPSGDTPAHGENVAKQSDALTQWSSGSIAGASFDTLVSLMQPSLSTVSVTQNRLQFLPSPAIASLMGVPAFQSDPWVHDVGGPALKLSEANVIWGPSIKLASTSPVSIDVDLWVNGSVDSYPVTCGLDGCATDSTPAGKLHIQASHLTFTFGVDPTTGSLVRTQTQWQPTMWADSNCMSDFYCYSLWSNDSTFASTIAWVQSQLDASVDAALAQYGSTTWLGALSKYVNTPSASSPGTPATEPQWQVVSSSINSSTIYYTAKREYPPTAPTCKASSACESIVTVSCSGSTDAMQLQYLTGGSWQWLANPRSQSAALTGFSVTAKGAGWMQLRACSSNGLGMACGNPFWAYVNSSHCQPLCTRDSAGVLHCVSNGGGAGVSSAL